MVGPNPGAALVVRAARGAFRFLLNSKNKIMAQRLIDELVPETLDNMILGLGLAVAKANQELSKIEFPGSAAGASTPAAPPAPVVLTIPEAEVEMRMSLTRKRETSVNVQAGGGLAGFTVSAGFSATFGYQAEASTRILVKFRAVPAA